MNEKKKRITVKLSKILANAVEENLFTIKSLKEEQFVQFDIEGVRREFEFTKPNQLKSRQFSIFNTTQKCLNFCNFMLSLRKEITAETVNLFKMIESAYKDIFENLTLFERIHKVKPDYKAKVLLRNEIETQKLLFSLKKEQQEVFEHFMDIFEMNVQLGRNCVEDAVLDKFRMKMKLTSLSLI